MEIHFIKILKSNEYDYNIFPSNASAFLLNKFL